MLSPLRELRTTASQAPVIVNGSAGELMALWQERIGEVAPPDFTHDLPVQLGKHLEPFLLDWMEQESGHPITERQSFIEHPMLPKLGATLDGYRAFDDATIELKVLSPWRKRLEIVQWYAPQVLVQMCCRRCARGVLAVLQGNAAIVEHDITELVTDEKYRREVFERLVAFQLCVDTMTPPVPLPQLVPPEEWRTVDLSHATPLPNWGLPMIESLRTWSDTRGAAKLHQLAREDVKELLPPDVGRVLFGATTVHRARNGAVSIREDAA